MLRIDSILFPTDYGACAEHAFDQAVHLAVHHGATLHIVHVNERAPDMDSPFYPDLPTLPAVTALGDDLRCAELLPENGSVADALLAYAAEHQIDLIVMGTHGKKLPNLRWPVLGSVADKVVRRAVCPVFTIRESAVAPSRMRRLLVPVDFSEISRAALRQAVELAKAYDAHLDLLHVVEPLRLPATYGSQPLLLGIGEVEAHARRALEDLVEEVRQAVPAEAHLLIGQPHQDIVDFAKSFDSDAIVLATHGLSGMKRLLLGSVAEQVVHHAPCPVLTLRAAQPAQLVHA